MTTLIAATSFYLPGPISKERILKRIIRPPSEDLSSLSASWTGRDSFVDLGLFHLMSQDSFFYGQNQPFAFPIILLRIP